MVSRKMVVKPQNEVKVSSMTAKKSSKQSQEVAVLKKYKTLHEGKGEASHKDAVEADIER